MKAKLVSETKDILTVILDCDATEEEAREVVGVPGTYHKRKNGLWIIQKD